MKNSDPAEHSVTADTGDAFNVEVEAGETALFTAPTAYRALVSLVAFT